MAAAQNHGPKSQENVSDAETYASCTSFLANTPDFVKLPMHAEPGLGRERPPSPTDFAI